MSYNPNPEWTKNIDYSCLQTVVCPHCGETPANFDEVVDELYEGSYYNARHIPPSLTFTCFNEECSHCDGNIVVNLKLIIEVVR